MAASTCWRRSNAASRRWARRPHCRPGLPCLVRRRGPAPRGIGPCQVPQRVPGAAPIPQIEEKAADLQAAIAEGANSFLFTEYKYVSYFMVRGARVGAGGPPPLMGPPPSPMELGAGSRAPATACSAPARSPRHDPMTTRCRPMTLR
jgi:hypothetical protein